MSRSAVGIIIAIVCFVLLLIAVGIVSVTGEVGWFAWDYLSEEPTVVVDESIPAPVPAPVGPVQPDLALTGSEPDEDAVTATPVPPPAPRDPGKKLFTCEESERTPIYPEDLTPEKEAQIRKDLGIVTKKGEKPEPLTGYRFRFFNPTSALGQWAANRGERLNVAYAEEVHVIGVKPVRICIDAEGRLQRGSMTPTRDGRGCVYTADDSVALGATVKTVCETLEGELVTHGDLYPVLETNWQRGSTLKAWVHCDQDGRRPGMFGNDYPGACRKATEEVAVR